MSCPLLTTLVLVLSLPAATPEPVDLDLVNRIRHEGFENSQVMEIAGQLTDVFGARVTGSPALRRAHEWSQEQLTEWGVEGARLEAYEFGRGWDWQSCRVDLLGDAARSLSAIPQAWTPGTEGPVSGEVMRMKATTSEELETFTGEVAGKIILLSEEKEVDPLDSAPFTRLGDSDLEDLRDFDIPEEETGESWRVKHRESMAFRRELDAYLHEHGALAMIDHSSRSHGILRVSRGGESDDLEPALLPALTMMTEQYNRLVRLVDGGHIVELEIEVAARFHGDRRSMAYNTVAEIPGRGKRDEVVMLGAHLDSYPSGTGATDNAAGCAVMMEALRILRAVGARPARTIRIALWSGEEQGLLGSKAWVRDNLAWRQSGSDPATLALPRAARPEAEDALLLRKAHGTLSVYLNMDNGGGRIRGIHTEGNVAVVPIFREWFAPFADLRASTISTEDTGGTDHVSFDRVGVPGFQFIQDPLDYSPQTHHTHLDTRDHLPREDLMQAAVIVASLAIHAANREEMLPRKPGAAE